MKDLLTYILKNLVETPDDIEVTEEESSDYPNSLTLKIKAHEDDKGLIIGKGGRIIKALRDVVSTKAIKEGKRVYLEIVDED